MGKVSPSKFLLSHTNTHAHWVVLLGFFENVEQAIVNAQHSWNKRQLILATVSPKKIVGILGIFEYD